MKTELRTGNTGCDCLNECGDDLRIGNGSLQLCEWGAARKAEREALVRLHAAAPKMLEELQWMAAHASSREIREIAARTVALATGDAA